MSRPRPRGSAAMLVVATLAAAGLGTSSAACASAAASESVTARSVAVTRPGAIGSSSSIVTFTSDGSVIELADGSVWLVASTSRSTVVNWSDGDTTAVIAAGELGDVGTGDTVSAQLIGSVGVKRPYRKLGDRTLVTLGNNGTLLRLSDGSVWGVSASGAPTVDRWPVGVGVRVSAHGHDSYVLQETRSRAHVVATYVAGEH